MVPVVVSCHSHVDVIVVVAGHHQKVWCRCPPPGESQSSFGECCSPSRTEQSPQTWVVMLAFFLWVCSKVLTIMQKIVFNSGWSYWLSLHGSIQRCWHSCKNSLPAGGSGNGGSCCSCHWWDDEGLGTFQKRGGPKGSPGAGSLHFTLALCPCGFLDLLFLLFGASWRHSSSSILKKRSLTRMSSSVKVVNHSISSLNSLMHAASWCSLSPQGGWASSTQICKALAITRVFLGCLSL